MILPLYIFIILNLIFEFFFTLLVSNAFLGDGGIWNPYRSLLSRWSRKPCH
jgi:hypothetical protein